MEVLIVLIAELLAAPLFAAFSAVLGFFGAILGGLLELIFALVSFGKSKRASRKAPEQPLSTADTSKPSYTQRPQPASWGRSRPQWVKWTERALAAGLAIIVLSLLAINFLFMEPTSKWIFAKVQDRTGIEVSASTVSGNLFTGRFEIADLVTRRDSIDKSSFDLQVGTIAVDIDMPSLVFGTATLQSIAIDAVSGRFEVKRRDKGKASRKIKTRRVFRIDDLKITNSALQLINADNEVLNLSLIKAASAPLRSDFAVYDLFFRSNVSGTLSGQKIEISSLEQNNSRETKWRIDRLPIATLGHFSENPLLNGLREGTLDIDVTNTWKVADQTEFDIDWRIIMDGVKLQVPDDATLKQKAALIPAAKYLSFRKKPIDVSFSLVMDEGRFQSAASLDAANFWRIVRERLVDALVLKFKTKEDPPVQNDVEAESEASSEDKPGIVKDSINRFKGFLNNRGTEPKASE